MKRKNNRLFWILGGILALLLIISYFFAKNKGVGEKVTMEKAEKRTIRETVSASGKIFPEREIKISSDVSGEIVELLIKEGDSIKKGQLLARISPDAYESSVERGKAGLNSSKAQSSAAKSQIEASRAGLRQAQAQRNQLAAQLDNVKAIHRRNEQLHKDGIISDADYEASLSNVKQIEANLQALDASISTAESGIEQATKNAQAALYNEKGSEASLKELNTSLRKTSIYAPTDGIVSKLNVEKGEHVVGTIQMTGTELMRIANMHTMEVQVDVNENDVLRIAIGNDVDVELDAYLKRKFKGKVTEIANTASNAISSTGQVSLTSDQVTNFVVKIRLESASYADLVTPNKPYPFRPGMSASVEILTNTISDALSVPIQAVTTRDDEKDTKIAKKVKEEDKTEEDNFKEVVFIHSADTVKMVEVKTGIQDDDYIQILSGLNVGDEVVTGPYRIVSQKLKSGKRVMKVDESEFNGKNEDGEDDSSKDDGMD